MVHDSTYLLLRFLRRLYQNDFDSTSTLKDILAQINKAVFMEDCASV